MVENITKEKIMIFTVPTKANLNISQKNTHEVLYKEEIIYSCPWILNSFCFEEIAQQRNLIISKLQELFTKTEINTK